MRPAQELVDEWEDLTPKDELSEVDLVRVTRVELLEELIACDNEPDIKKWLSNWLKDAKEK